MKIVILGAGRIGGSLARNLSKSNYQVLIVDQNKDRLSELEDKLDIMTVEGNASSLLALKKSGLDEDTIVIAVIILGNRSVNPSALFAKLFEVTPKKTAIPRNKYEVARLIK